MEKKQNYYKVYDTPATNSNKGGFLYAAIRNDFAHGSYNVNHFERVTEEAFVSLFDVWY